MPYKLRGNSVVKSDSGEVVKTHKTREQALKHLRALKVNVENQEAVLCECGAPARGRVCQRGHRLEETWSPQARVAAALSRRRKGGMLHPRQLKPGIQFDRDGAGGGPYEVLADKGDKLRVKDLDSGHEFDHPKSQFPVPYKAKTYEGMRGLHYVGTRGEADDVTSQRGPRLREAWSPQARAAAALARREHGTDWSAALNKIGAARSAAEMGNLSYVQRYAADAGSELPEGHPALAHLAKAASAASGQAALPHLQRANTAIRGPVTGSFKARPPQALAQRGR